jgi:transcriptional regulator with XRE-family HTH domain
MNEILIHNIRLLRGVQNLSGKSLSLLLGLNKSRINNLELGQHRPTLDEVQAIAKYFDVTIDDLLNKRAVVRFE